MANPNSAAQRAFAADPYDSVAAWLSCAVIYAIADVVRGRNGGDTYDVEMALQR